MNKRPIRNGSQAPVPRPKPDPNQKPAPAPAAPPPRKPRLEAATLDGGQRVFDASMAGAGAQLAFTFG